MKHVFTILFLLLFWTNTTYAQNRGKEVLLSLIEDSDELLENAKEGTQAGEYLAGSKSAFEQAVRQAEMIYENEISTNQALDDATKTLFDAYRVFLKQKHGITNPNYSDNYWQLHGEPSKWAHYNTHDPSIVYADGYWYAFCTDAAWNYVSQGIPVKRSRDLVNWEARGWAFNGYPQEAKDIGNAIRAGNVMNGIWAPYIQNVDGEYRLYYCAVYESGDAAMILAVSDNIEGPWTHRGLVLGTMTNSEFNAIDPTVVVDENERFWMIYGSWHQGIAYVELDPETGLKKQESTPVRISRNRASKSGWKNSTEGPEIIYNKQLDKYFMFLAQGNLGTVYHTRVVRADHPTGPWYDYSGNVADYATDKDIYPLIQYPYQFNNHPGWVGIAHSAAIFDGNDYFLVNQARPVPMSSMMVMHVRKIYWTEDGWPVLSPERYANKGIMPGITEEDLVGTWERIVFNEYASSGITVDVPANDVPFSRYLCTSQYMILKAGGATGTTEQWSFSDNVLTLTNNEKITRLFVDWEWDWENQQPAIVFTGIGATGKGIWGKKVIDKEPDDNIVLNDSFDDDLNHWIITRNSGDFEVSATNNGINGKSFYVKCNSSAPNYWDQQISWFFPASKCSRYRVRFRAKASVENVDIRFEVQDYVSIIPVIRTEQGTITVGTTERTYEFITNDVALSSNLYTMNLQYGFMPDGAELWIDDIVLEDISVGWYNNYITNGKFADGLTCWSRKIPRGGRVELDESVLINGNATVKLEAANTLSTWSAAGISWDAYLYFGMKYYYQFDAVSETGMDVKLRILSGNTEIGDFDPIHIEQGLATYRFVIPELAKDNTYTVDLNFGRTESNSTAWISDVRLVPCTNGDCEISGMVAPVFKKSLVKTYPNPVANTLFIAARENIKEVFIYNLCGKLHKREIASSSEHRMDVSDLISGNYLLKVSTENAESCQMIIKE